MNIFSVLLILCAFLFLMMIIYRKFLFYGVTYECSFSKDEVTEGDEIEFTEIITNRKLLPVSWLKSEITLPAPLEFSELSSVVTDKTRWVTSFFVLRSFSRIRRTWKVKCTHRGIFRIEKIIISATDPLGLAKNYFIIDEYTLNAKSVTVFPVCDECHQDYADTGILSGDVFTSPKLISDPFFINGIREYRITDHIKNINWTATAKEQQLMVNRNDYTTDRDVAVILNIQSSPADIREVWRPDLSEKCIRVCASIIRSCCECGQKVRLLSNDISAGETTDVSASDEVTLFRVLAGMNLKPGEDFGRYLVSTAAELYNTEIIVITVFRTEEFDILRYECPDISFVYPDLNGGGVI